MSPTSPATAPTPIRAAQAASASLVLAPLLERLVSGRRVVVLGEATLGLATELTSRGARLVHVYDPDAGRAAQAMVTLGGRNVAYAPLSEDLGIRDGAFDLALLPDLSLFAHPASAIARARQLTGQRGVVIVGCEATPDFVGEAKQAPAVDPTTGEPRSAKLGYYELYDALSLAFREVKMLGQLPFSGYAMVDFGAEGDVVVSVDTSLTDGNPRTPRYFYAVGSDTPVQIEDYTIVELPAAALPEDGDEDDAGSTTGAEESEGDGPQTLQRPGDQARLVDQLEEQRQKLIEVAAHGVKTAAELETERHRRVELEARVAEETRLKGELTELVRAYEQRAKDAIALAQETERRAVDLSERLRVRESQVHMGEGVSRIAASMQQRVVTLEHELQTVAADLARAEEELRRAAAREQQAARLVADLRAQRIAAKSAVPAPPQAPAGPTLEQRTVEAKLARTVDELRAAEQKLAKQAQVQAALQARLDAQPDDRSAEQVRALEVKLTQAIDAHRAAEQKLAQVVAALQQAEAKTAQLDAQRRAIETALTEERAAHKAAAEKALAEQQALREKAARLDKQLVEAQRAASEKAASPADDAARKEVEARLNKALDERNVLSAQLVTAVAEKRALEADKATLHERLTRTTRELDTLQEAQAADFIAAENVLRERSRELSLLQREVDRRGDLVRELLTALDTARTEGFTPLPTAAAAAHGHGHGHDHDHVDVDALVEELGRRRKEVTDSAQQRDKLVEQLAQESKETRALAAELSLIREEMAKLQREQLERKRELAEANEKLTRDPRDQRAALEREIDTLRRALVEERAARLRAEETLGLDANEKANEGAVLRAQTEASASPERQG